MLVVNFMALLLHFSQLSDPFAASFNLHLLQILIILNFFFMIQKFSRDITPRHWINL